jgi:5-methylcytosine-specific restriction endonuclease McrA
MKLLIPGGDEKQCFICHRTGPLERHHVLHGSRRKMADKYHLTVMLCPECHRNLHDHGSYDLALEQIGQRAFESEYGHEEYMRIFGKNYL